MRSMAGESEDFDAAWHYLLVVTTAASYDRVLHQQLLIILCINYKLLSYRTKQGQEVKREDTIKRYGRPIVHAV